MAAEGEVNDSKSEFSLFRSLVVRIVLFIPKKPRLGPPETKFAFDVSSKPFDLLSFTKSSILFLPTRCLIKLLEE